MDGISDDFAIGILMTIGAHVVVWGTCIGILIYLFIRRVKIKETEDFEERDN